MIYKKYKQYVDDKIEFINTLNERWSSKNIMGLIDLADKNSERAWYRSFIKDFYKKFNVSVDKIQDKDWEEIKPNAFFEKQPYNLNPDKYLAVFINDDPKLKQLAKTELGKFVKAKKDAIANGASKQDIESIKAQMDLNKALEIPFLVAIGMGRRAVYYGFVPESKLQYEYPQELLPPQTKQKGIQYSTPRQVLRYGINAAMWLQMRYYGLEKGEKLTGKNTADRSTRAFVIDVEEMAVKYGMGDKLKDREAAKANNPFFMTDDEAKMLNQNRYKIMKDKDLTPEKLQKELQSIVTAYTAYYTDLISNPTKANVIMALKNQTFKIEGKEYKGIAKVFEIFTGLMEEYFEIYKEFNKLMKDTPAKFKKMRTKKQAASKEYETEHKAFKDKHDKYVLDMIDLRDKGHRIVSQLSKSGVTFKIKK